LVYIYPCHVNLNAYRHLYYGSLNAYHEGRPNQWLDFFLDAVIETAEAGIVTSKKITSLRGEDMQKVQALGKREASSDVRFLQQLFSVPIVTVGGVVTSMGYTRAGAGSSLIGLCTSGFSSLGMNARNMGGPSSITDMSPCSSIRRQTGRLR
jgi:Fic family protein